MSITATTSATATEIGKAVVLTPRIKKLKEDFLAAHPRMCSERGHLATQSWKETEGQPEVLRRAKLIKKILEGIPIAIREGELIVGTQTKAINGVYPDIDNEDPERIRKEIVDEKLIYGDERTEGLLSDEDCRIILEDIEYWKGKTLCCRTRNVLQELWGSKADDFDKAGMWTGVARTIRARTIDFAKGLNKGLNGVIAEIEAEDAKLKNKLVLNEQEIDKHVLLQSMIIACQGVINWSKRYAELAKQLAKDEKNATRKSELERIAQVCDNVPANPARNFWEAVQSFYFLLLALNLATSGSGDTPGRADQYLYPFYKKDIEEGSLTVQEAVEIWACCFLKMGQIHCAGTGLIRSQTQGSQFMNVTIAGVKEDGSDAVNDVSYLTLRVIGQIRPIQPHVSVRYHDAIDQQFFYKSLECNREHGGGMPAFFNDKTALVNLMEKGIPLEEARNWGPQGCVERMILPSSSLIGAGPFYNLAKILELTLNNGVDPRTGLKIGISTGDPTSFKSFEELYEAYKKQTWEIAKFCAAAENLYLITRSHHYALPYDSALMPGCMESGLDELAGGARWGKTFLATLRPFGMQNTISSFAAIKKLVFEEKKISMKELLNALRVNFEGKEDLRKMLLDAPKWGNDDNYVDDIMCDMFKWTEAQVVSLMNPWGKPYTISRQGPTMHIIFGKVVGALPDGRKAYTYLVDGTMSAMTGTDKKGPIGIIMSASKPDQIRSESTLLNLKFNPSAVQSIEGIRKWGALIKTYFDNYGHHCQFNILSRETLLDAKAHPEKHRDLVIRVAGFSAFFVDLPDMLQDELIDRSQHELN